MVLRRNMHFSWFFRHFLGDFYLTEIGISIIIVMIFSNTDFSYQTGRFLRFGNKKVNSEGKKGGVSIWKWHISRKKGTERKSMGSGAGWAQRAEGKFWQPEGQREERDYPHRSQYCDLFSLLHMPKLTDFWRTGMEIFFLPDCGRNVYEFLRFFKEKWWFQECL